MKQVGKSRFGAIRSRLWLRLGLLFLAASLLPLGGAGTLTLYQIERSVQKAAERRLDAMAELGAGLVRELLGRGREKLRTLSRLLVKEMSKELLRAANVVTELRQDRLVENLNRLVEPPDVFLELQYYAAEKGPRQARFLGQARQSEFENAQTLMPDIETLRKGQIVSNLSKPLVQKPFVSNKEFTSERTEKLFGFPTLSLSMPVSLASAASSGGTQVLGVLVGYLDLRKLSARLELLAAAGYRVSLGSESGEVISEIGSLDGEGIGRSKAVGFSDWVIEVSEPLRVVKEGVWEARKQVIIWLVAALVLAIVLSFGISLWLGRAVSELTTAVRMEAGDLSARSGISGKDELGQLGHAFDRMATALESLDQAKSDFIANVSHELRSPLTSMRLSIANLSDGVVGSVTEKQRKTLVRIQSDVDRLIALVNDLLEMARLEAGTSDPRKVLVQLLDIAKDSADGLSALAAQRAVKIEFTGSGEACADPAMLRRIFCNLIDNAVKFSPVGGNVRIALSDAQFSVSDEGPGFEGDQLFERFRQGEQDGVKNKGAGLGLAIVKKLVELHGGSIEHASGQGTTLIVRL